MATLQELESALLAADRAGNVDDARLLAAEITRLRSPMGSVSQSVNVEQDMTPPPLDGSVPLRELARFGAETGGALAGGARGALAGSRFGPLGTLIGALAGAGAGAGGATAIERGAETVIQPLTGIRPDLTPERIGQDILRSGWAGVVGELTGRGFAGGINRFVAKPIGRSITGSKYARPEDFEIADRAERMGITLRPAEVSQSDVAAQYEMNTSRSMFGKSQFQSRDIENEKAFSSYIDNLVQQEFGRPLTTQDAGATIQQIVKGESIPAWKRTRDSAYEQVNALVTQPVKSESLLPIIRDLQGTVDAKLFPRSRAILDKMEQEITQPGPITGLTVKRAESPGLPERMVEEKDIYGATIQRTVPAESAKLKGLAIQERSEAPRQPRDLSFQEAIDLRSYLLSIGREAGESLPDRAQGLAGKLAGLIDQQMGQAAKNSGTMVYDAWRTANKIVKDGHELFDSSTIQTLLKTNPESVVSNTFRKNALTANERIMAALKDSPEGQRLYRNESMQKALRDASVDGYLNGQKFYNVLFGRNGVGEEVLNRIYPSSFVDELKETANVGRRMSLSTLPSNAGNPSQTGRSLINWFEQSMIVNIPADFLKNAVQGKFGEALKSVAMNSAQTGTYILTQKNLAELLNSKEGLRVLREGMQIGPASERAIRVTAQLLSMATSESAKASPPAISPAALPNKAPYSGELWEGTIPRMVEPSVIDRGLLQGR